MGVATPVKFDGVALFGVDAWRGKAPSCAVVAESTDHHISKHGLDAVPK